MAILSMDSYNQGYGAGITLPDSPTIGNATIINTGPASDAWVTAGFYAAAYDTDYGTVISYRGTNFTSGAAYADIVNGWAFAAGDFTADQIELSTRFLENIVLRDASFNITLTGHSLGGGLAECLNLNPYQ